MKKCLGFWDANSEICDWEDEAGTKPILEIKMRKTFPCVPVSELKKAIDGFQSRVFLKCENGGTVNYVWLLKEFSFLRDKFGLSLKQCKRCFGTGRISNISASPIDTINCFDCNGTGKELGLSSKEKVVEFKTRGNNSVRFKVRTKKKEKPVVRVRFGRGNYPTELKVVRGVK